ncbi:hypothetical protein HQ305_14175 [Rhodococcus sp. BP-149]|uniref:hypothetical protein n=1 Tax=unclassified Rhodococcus (in: high G+C Gram-positive bacteria) TaxID=192944 RepID=UPI001C9AF27F|nr:MULTISPECIES: hypothetical protein [unclassified Rhodococcus (in: high G+C Gram-positive bacteria)]MBY6686706.1 hypothetical protein [Rhodococcus sp. BP-288]MBY6695568.1 hypothetical protein [Rhodococcus sp. BP-188]MBY6700198.1 hypothetical protein [Rhodococcus sp. BP-285]MBY6704779.1 hypothetical protein [Rhodococcus sp. BP-283]MBY6713323.1 hypothetical protein [Rhodococcus sp. BP-160]
MLEPNGPLPPEIYWRRRALAIGGAVVVIGLVVWLVVSLAGGGSQDSESTAASASLAPSAATTYRPDASATGGSAPAGGSGGGGGGGDAASSSSATSTSATTSSAPVAPGQCTDQSLAVKASPDQPSYPAGQEPAFTVVVTNIGTSACERDLGSGLQQVLVYTLEGQRLWSNVDCFPTTTPDIRTLQPGEQAPFAVKWSATTSEPGCAAPRNPVGPGGYSVVGQLGQLRSAPETFNIT